MRPGLALIYSDLGLEPEARALFEQLAEYDFADLAQDALRVGTIAYLSEVCAFLGDTARAAILYRLLSPYVGHNVIMGFAAACYGAASHYLGLLAATMSLWKEAETHFLDALEMNARIGAKPYLAQTQYRYAGMLLQRSQAGDQTNAMALLDEALASSKELRMIPLAEKLEALRSKT